MLPCIVLVQRDLLSVGLVVLAEAAYFAHHVANCPRKDLPLLLAFVCMFTEQILVRLHGRHHSHFRDDWAEPAEQEWERNRLINYIDRALEPRPPIFDRNRDNCLQSAESSLSEGQNTCVVRACAFWEDEEGNV